MGHSHLPFSQLQQPTFLVPQFPRGPSIVDFRIWSLGLPPLTQLLETLKPLLPARKLGVLWPRKKPAEMQSGSVPYTSSENANRDTGTLATLCSFVLTHAGIVGQYLRNKIIY